MPFLTMLLIDWLNPPLPYESSGKHSNLYYDSILHLLSALQFINIFGLVKYVSELPWDNANAVITSLVNLVALRFVVGTSSGASGIVVAHELIHRPQNYLQQLGRLLLCTTCYEHFVIAHKRGHHLNLCLPEDIATARLGESFKDYWRRVYWGYFRYAWQSEQDRLSHKEAQSKLIPLTVRPESFDDAQESLVEGQIKSFLKPNKFRLFANQVLQGVIVELALILLIINIFGWLAAFMFCYQALAAIRILEAVNYFQHWGLENGQFGKTYGWYSQSWLSRYALIGLSHHIGHHEDEHRQYFEIAYSEQGPKLPYGYFVMNLWVKLNNGSYQRMALNELDKFQQMQG
ncbi:MAG: fatty acid desaturase [Gammaproteobacteria bacterium]|nr:fatty acid desaturase [Gammaproteobacteria bacterium]